MKELIRQSALAGILISLAGAIYINCANKIVGSLLFSIGLISVIVLQTSLFTGKIGYVNSRKNFFDSLIILIVNVTVAFCCGLLLKIATQESAIMASRYDKKLLKVFLDGVGCGALIYLACELYQRTSSLIPVILCVMGFILAGFEHSVADAFYLGVGEFRPEGLLIIFLVILGNAVGSLIIRILQVGYEHFKD